MGEFEHRFWKNRAVDIETEVIAWKSMFRPAIEYGSEVWWPLVQQLEPLERLQRKVCKWILGCCRSTANEVVLGELGLPTLNSRFMRARLAFAGVVKRTGKERILGLCGQIDTTGIMPRRYTWSRVVSKALIAVGLEGNFQCSDLGTGAEEEEVLESWKRSVKSAVLVTERAQWKDGLAQKSKSELYAKIKEDPEFEPYLHIAEYLQCGKLRFNLRSGMCMLNVEKGRRSGEREDRMCSLCVQGVEETVEHFLFVCPVFNHLRAQFENNLASRCSRYSTPSLLVKWRSGVHINQAHIVLGDCTKFILSECERESKPGDVAREVRLISNRFIVSLWNARKKLLFSDLALASGAQSPQCGSAS